MYRKLIRAEGFNLLELVIIIFIVSLALIGVLSLSLQNDQAQHINNNRLIASQLAQEGLELVRNKRDINWMNGADYKTGILVDGTYTIDYSGTINQAVDNISDVDADLYFDANNFYTHTDTGSPAFFKRLITVTQPSAEYLDVKSTVQWKEHSDNYIYEAETYLYDWY